MLKYAELVDALKRKVARAREEKLEADEHLRVEMERMQRALQQQEQAAARVRMCKRLHPYSYVIVDRH